ncbi:hypothetical protein [Actinacidiphila sp. ITFR-21]|uniref:hypothetical protein n=1 Tax=Actinacidiphila sp. ITFR-21 TaxID=3075199 RepID=UPI00288B2C78|nr:hypothetical protein [Streptomyces sp. ITFR-21]WNI15552.1 hypothetical protein RLT57_08450 [Streptomyces sp. ITFR-21]
MQLALGTPTPAAPAAAGPGPRPLVIGLDLSLRSTGLAGADWTDAIRTTTVLTGPARITYLRREIRDRVKAADLAVIEGPSHGSALQTGHHEMAGLWWAVVCDLHAAGIPYAVVPPDCRTIYATGKARWAGEKSPQVKGRVRDVVRERYGVECEGPARYDRADAFILAAMGLDWLGYQLALVPVPSCSRGMDGVTWPAVVPVVAR